MGEARVRRFPPVSGPYGWIGAAFVFLALASQMVDVFLLFWLVLNRDGRVVIPMIIFFVLSFALLGAALALWRIGMQRSGTLRPSTIPREQQRQVFGTLAVMNLATSSVWVRSSISPSGSKEIGGWCLPWCPSSSPASPRTWA